MSFLWFIVAGIMEGLLASMIMKKSGAGLISNLSAGICGGLTGGYVATEWGIDFDISTIKESQMLVATAGSVILLFFVNFSHARKRDKQFRESVEYAGQE